MKAQPTVKLSVIVLVVLSTFCRVSIAEEMTAFRVLSTDASNGVATSRTSQFVIWYSERIDPESFKATLNGADVSELFRPAPNIIETVRLPYKEGLNELTVGGALKGETDLAMEAQRYKIDYRGLKGLLEVHVEEKLGLSDEEVRKAAEKKFVSISGRNTN